MCALRLLGATAQLGLTIGSLDRVLTEFRRRDSNSAMSTNHSGNADGHDVTFLEDVTLVHNRYEPHFGD